MWNEKETKYKFNLVENEGGPTLGYDPESGVKLIEKDGLAFKDLAKCGELLPYEDWRLAPEERAEDLAKRLSASQIAGLMCYSAHQFSVEKEPDEAQKAFLEANVRSVLNACSVTGVDGETQIVWANAMQRVAESLPMGIPCYIASDPRTGSCVSDWPGNLSLAATFDPELAKESAKCQSIELRNLGIACYLAPQVDVAAEPRWFRNDGTFGEDPALARDMTRAFCDGIQSTYGPDGEDLGWGKDSMSAMVKHWTGEGAGEGGREAHLEGGKFGVYPNGNFETLMIPFVDGAFQLEGKTKSASAVMSSYSIAFSDDKSLGEYVGSSYSEYKIKELLRGRYGFDGVVCTDWMVLNEAIKEGGRCNGWGALAENPEVEPGEKALAAILVGVDQMGGCSNPQVLIRAYEIGSERYGKEFMDQVFTDSAKRLLKGYFRTGIFENPYLDVEASCAIVNSPDRQEAALDAQLKSVIMLKNTNGAIRKRDERIRVYVPALYEAAHKRYDHVFGMQVKDAAVSYPLSLASAQKYFDVVTDHVDGANIIRLTKEELEGIDLIFIPVKEPGNSFAQDGRESRDSHFMPITCQYRPYVADGPYVRKVSVSGNILADGSKENRSYYGQKAMCTNEAQLDQILEFGALAKELGVPSVACLFIGKPICVHEFEPYVDSIMVSMGAPNVYPGAQNTASVAMAQIVAGQAEPSGLLPMQMPKNMDDIERQAEDTPRDMECYTDTQGHRYDFAYGMNYSGVICDDRVKKYSVPALTRPVNKGTR